MTPDRPKYQYKPIDLATDAIRLIRLVRGSFTDSVCCELLQSYLDRSIGVPYEALSYVWGDEPDEKAALEIVNEGLTTLGYLEIYPNLHEILRHLRKEDKDRILWIDAICIDQRKHCAGATQERNHQVGQMTLVYENAWRVLAWLGHIDIDMAKLLRVANEFDKKIFTSSADMASSSILTEQFEGLVVADGYQSLNNFLIEGRMSSAMSRILNLPWFRRTWIIQEVASAKNGKLLAAEEEFEFRVSVPMRSFALLPSIMQSKHTHHTQAILDVMPRGGQRRDGWWKEKPDLATLLRKFTNSECREPQDSVYALLGICSDKIAKTILRPDYEMPLETFLRNTLSYALFGEILDPGSYELPAEAMWNSPPDGPHLTRSALSWALENNSENVALRLVDLEDKLWQQHFGLTFPALSKLLKQQDLDSAAHLGRGFGARILLPRAMEKEDLIGLSKIYLNMDTEASALDELLSASVSKRKVELAQYLLEAQGVHVKPFRPRWAELLCATLRKKDTAMIHMLSQRTDIQIDFKGLEFYDNPLYIATLHRMSDAVEWLLQHASFDASASEKHVPERALASAAETGQVQIFERIWNHKGISIDANYQLDGQSLLAIAAAQVEGGLPMARLILAGTHGVVDVNKPSVASMPGRPGIQTTPLKIAALNGCNNVVRYLLDTQKRLDLEAGSGDAYGTALWAAAHRNHFGIVKLLLEHGASLKARGYKSLERRYRGGDEIFPYIFTMEHRFDRHGWDFGQSAREWGSDGSDQEEWERSEGRTPLEEAMALNNDETVEVIRHYEA